MSAKAMNLSDAVVKAGHGAELVDHFWDYQDTQMWTKLDSDTGASVAISSTLNGLVFTTGATNNNECYIESTRPAVDVIDKRPFVVGAVLQYAEAATDDANVIFGFSNAAMANLLQDDGAGPATTYDGAFIYKIDGETVWRTGFNEASSQTGKKSKTTAGGTKRQHLRIRVEPKNDGTLADVTFEASDNGPLSLRQLLEDSVSPLVSPIQGVMTVANYAAMNIQFGAKAGGANSEVVTLYALYAYQTGPQ